MEVEEVDNITIVEPVIFQDKESEEVIEKASEVMLNTLIGDAFSTGDTMRVKGMVWKKTLHILVDTGSSHNFLSEKFTKILQDQVAEMNPLQVTVADEGRVVGSKMVKGFTWSMQGNNFSADVILFQLVGCDLILGMKWLKTLGPITCDCNNLTMEFRKGDQRVTLKACPEVKNQWLRGDKRQAQLRELHAYCIQVVSWQT